LRRQIIKPPKPQPSGAICHPPSIQLRALVGCVGRVINSGTPSKPLAGKVSTTKPNSTENFTKLWFVLTVKCTIG
jgi:hypothetical protein